MLIHYLHGSKCHATDLIIDATMAITLYVIVYSSNLLSLKQTSVGDLGLSFSITNNDMGERQVSIT